MGVEARRALFRECKRALNLHRRFDFSGEHAAAEGADQPLPGAWFVDDLHVDGSDDPRAALRLAIESTDSADCYFLSGLRGSGKTSELLRLRHEMEATGEAVVLYVDMTEYLALHIPVEIGDFLVTVVSALADEADRWLGLQPGDAKKVGLIDGFLHFVRRLNVEGIDLEVGTGTASPTPIAAKATLKLRMKENEAFKAKLQEATRKRIDRVVDEARTFVAEVVQRIRDYGRQPNLRVVLLVDSVERLEGAGQQAATVFDSVEQLFSAHGHRLRFPDLDVVYTVPPWIGAAAVAQSGRVFALPVVPVFQRPAAGEAHGATRVDAVRRLTALLQRRVPDWAQVFTQQQLERLALHAGGDLREFFLLVSNCIGLPGLLREDVPLPVPDEAIEQAEKLRRNQFGPIPADQMAWLQRVVASHGSGLESRNDLATLATLLSGKLVMRYRNGDDWYDVHPLLWERVEGVHAAPA